MQGCSQYLICLACLMLNREQRLHQMLLRQVRSPAPSSEAAAACQSCVHQEASSIRLQILKDGLWRVDWPFWLADELEGDTLCGLTLQGCYTDCCDICPGHAARDGVALPWKTNIKPCQLLQLQAPRSQSRLSQLRTSLHSFTSMDALKYIENV